MNVKINRNAAKTMKKMLESDESEGKMLRVVGRIGRRNLPRGVRPVRRRHTHRTRGRVRQPGPAADRHADYPELTRHR